MDLDPPAVLLRALERLQTVDAELAETGFASLRRWTGATDALLWARDQLADLARPTTEIERLQVLIDKAVALTEAPEAWAMTWVQGHAGSRVRALAGQGAGRTFDGSWIVPSEISRSVLGLVVRERRPAWSDDAMSDARYLGAESVQAMQLRSVGCVPIGEHGALYLHDPSQPGRFGPEARHRISALCTLAAALIQAPRDEPPPPGPEPLEGLVGQAPPMRELSAAVRAFAPMPWPVLVLGESGTGKEAVARAIHELSGRGGPFVAVSAATLVPDLAGSTLFGHERGAFTGAAGSREGLVAEARGGTLFLDEVGEMPATVQTQLLRLLQEGTYRRLGSDRERTFEGRIVAATHRPIDEAEDGFRADLYHRLSACVIRTPALRERVADLPLLVDHLLARAADEADIAAPSVPEAVLDALRRRTWSGNVRELLNVLRSAVARCAARGGTALALDDLTPARPGPAGADGPWPNDLQLATTLFQQARVRDALEQVDGNRTRAAELLGVSRQWLHRLIARWDAEGW